MATRFGDRGYISIISCLLPSRASNFIPLLAFWLFLISFFMSTKYFFLQQLVWYYLPCSALSWVVTRSKKLQESEDWTYFHQGDTKHNFKLKLIHINPIKHIYTARIAHLPCPLQARTLAPSAQTSLLLSQTVCEMIKGHLPNHSRYTAPLLPTRVLTPQPLTFN